MGGKSKKVTVGYKYNVGEHLILCHGPIDSLSRMQCDGRDAWVGSSTGGSITVSAEDLFGGESREGGVGGTVDLEMGGPTQGQNSYLVAQLGSDVPGYRGVVGLVFRQFYFGNNPYLKPWSFRGTRILKAAGGEEQWYSAKAIIPSSSQVTSVLTFDLPSTLTPIGQRTVSAIIANDLGYTFTTSPQSIVSFEPTPGGTYSGVDANGDGWRWPLRVMGDDDGSATLYSVPGNPQYATQELCLAAVNTHLESSSFLDTGHSTYRVWTDLENNNSSIGVGGLSVTATITEPVTLDMNPAHIIRECLTNPDWGMGYQETDIDDVAFMAAADTLFNEGLGISLLWDRQITIDAFIQEIVRHIDAALYVDRTTGKFVLKLIRNDYDAGDLIILDESNISKVSDPVRATFGELVNSVTVNYWDAVTGKDASITVQDTALVQMQGAVINTTLQYPGFTNGVNAGLAGQRDLRVLSAPFLFCTIYADRTAEDLNIGDTFKFRWSRWQISEMIMRVTGIAIGNGKNRQVRITCTQDVYSTPTVSVVVPGGSEWVDPSAPPSALTNTLVLEAPYFELVQSLGQSDIDGSLAAKNDIGYAMGAAARSGGAINGRLWVDDGSGYEDVGGLDFCPYAAVATAVTALTTVFNVESTSGLDQVELGTFCQVGDELCRVDAIDTGAGTVTLGRGVLDTVPVPHEAGTGIFFWDLFSGYDPTEYVSGEVLDIKLQPTSGAGVLSLGSIAAEELAMAQRAFRPYPPGDLRINTESYAQNATYEGELALSWAHRDRVQQTSGTLADHFDGDIGPEAGTTYRVQGYVDGVLEHTEDDIATTSTTWTPAVGAGTIKVEVHSKRDGIYSLQGAWHEFFYSNGGLRATEDSVTRVSESGDLRLTED